MESLGLEGTLSSLLGVLIPRSVPCVDAVFFAALHVRILPVGNRYALVSSTG